MVERILLAHGGGGQRSQELMVEIIAPTLGALPEPWPDAAAVPGAPGLRFTTDSFVVKPLFFPGGNIGSLAVHGTLNDLAVSGAQPLAISLALILEEGLEIDVLRQVLSSVAQATADSGLVVVTGDTKVVPHGQADGVFICTSGIGRVLMAVSPAGLKEGDMVILSGPLGEHGVAVMSAREGLRFDTLVESDSRSVWPLVETLIDHGIQIHAMRDPTRGGLAACCNELADASGVSLLLEESDLPIPPAVAEACEMLGLDPLTVANEGKLCAVVAAEDASKALELLRACPHGQQATCVGTVGMRRDHGVYLGTRYGGQRIVTMPYGEDLPRIC